MLELLDKVDGVESAMANHTGTLVRVSLVHGADANSVSLDLKSILEKQNRKAKPLAAIEIAKAIEDEQWRTSETIGELSEIEFRTVFEKRVKQFTESNDLDEEVSAKLMKFSVEILDATAKSDNNTDWKEFCRGLAEKMLEKARPLLSEEKLEELSKQLKARVLG